MHLLKFGRVINLETANGSDARHSQAKMAAPCEILEKCFSDNRHGSFTIRHR